MAAGIWQGGRSAIDSQVHVLPTTPKEGLESSASDMTMPGTVLIVEDDKDLREVVSETLTEEGYTVHQATNGLQAMGMLKEGLRPCIVLLDLMMPIMDGWAFRKMQLKDEGIRDIPVIAITASPEAAAEYIDAPMLRKPMNARTLLNMVAAHCPC